MSSTTKKAVVKKAASVPPTIKRTAVQKAVDFLHDNPTIDHLIEGALQTIEDNPAIFGKGSKSAAVLHSIVHTVGQGEIDTELEGKELHDYVSKKLGLTAK